MTKPNGNIPDLTLETLSRSFFREAKTYGFTSVDYVKFVNLLLDLAMQSREDSNTNGLEQAAGVSVHSLAGTSDLDLPLRGDRIMIRPLDAAHDLHLFANWMNDPLGRYFLLSRTTTEEPELEDVVLSETSVVGIITLPDSTPIGSVAFLHNDPVQGKAELRKLIGEPSRRGKGYAKEATALWIRYGRETLGLSKIYLNTFDTNIRNIKLNEELGFKVEGILRNEVLVNGRPCDVLRMGLWCEENGAEGSQRRASVGSDLKDFDSPSRLTSKSP